jgi:thioredoxin 1
MNKMGKIGIVVALIVAVIVVIALRQNQSGKDADAPTDAIPIGRAAVGRVPEEYTPENFIGKGLPALIDIGAGTCIPCKLMAPILEELKKGELQGKIVVQFIDLNKFPNAARVYGILVMPTQIFYDATGKELFRHEGFFSKEDILGKWKELGITFEKTMSGVPVFERYVYRPAMADSRPKEQVCYMCDGDIHPKTLVTVKTEKGDVRLCGLHCYFIMYSCLTEDKTDFEKKVTVADFVSGEAIPLTEAVFLSGMDTAGRPTIQAYAEKVAAEQARQDSGGNVIGLTALTKNELSHRCGFCDRACYPQDASKVIVDGGIQTWGCCSHCALGVAVRTGKDIEIHEKDRLTGELIVVKTLNGSVASLEPSTAVAWFGQREKADGNWGSAGCFHQGFFTSVDNLKKWVLQQNPRETGKLISIHQALADKMKLSPTQIQNACKIGECAPK